MADDKLNPEASGPGPAGDKPNPEAPGPGPGGRLDPGAGAELYVAAAADGGIDLSGLEAGPGAEDLPPPSPAAPLPPGAEDLPPPLPEAPPAEASAPSSEEDEFIEDNQAGAVAAQAESQRVATQEARAMDALWLRLPYLTAFLGFLKVFFIWLWKQFKAIPPLDDLFDQAIFSLGMQRKPGSMMRRAGNLIMQGRLNEAVRAYRDILALRPLSVPAYDGLGRAYFRLGLTDEANREFTIAESLERLLHNRDDLEAAVSLAQAFLDRKQPKMAISLVEPILINHFYAPDNSELLKTMGRVYAELRLNKKVYQVYSAGLAQHPEDYEYHLLKGASERRLGNDAEGERLAVWGNLMKRLKENPRDYSAKMTMGEIRFKENAPKEAVRFLREAAALSPDNAGLRMNIADICFKQHLTKEGLKFLREAAVLSPDNGGLRMTIADICFKERQTDEGVKFLGEAAALSPDNAGLRMTIGEMCLKEQRSEEGLKFLGEAAVLSPDNTGLRWRLYNLYMKQGNVDEALRYFREIVALDPDNDDLQYRLADFCRKHQRREEALPIYKALAEKHPREPKPHIMWGDLLFEMGQMEEGQRLKDLAKLLSYGLKANPDHHETMAFMNYLFSIGQQAEAYEWLDRGLSKWPYHGELVMLKVKTLYNEYRYQEAVPYLKRLISVRPDVPEPHIWLAMCYQRLGDNMVALAEARLCTRLAPKSYVAHKVLGDVLKEQKKISQANAAYEVAEMMRQKR
ncbi:MAG: tetratricopeptide repeat protein [Candidatus Adiutrix sp.]|jgi:tetratricopeptide (TPR) repeat protein|nr:tetratricopeptide repeat protein [Candidatus Adiutrix sp.]